MEIICAIENCGKVFTQKCCDDGFFTITAEDGEDILDHEHNLWEIESAE